VVRRSCVAPPPNLHRNENAQFRRWRDDIAHQRPHPEQRDRRVADVFAEEQPRLLPLPAHPFETDIMRTVTSGKTPYVRFNAGYPPTS